MRHLSQFAAGRAESRAQIEQQRPQHDPERANADAKVFPKRTCNKSDAFHQKRTRMRHAAAAAHSVLGRRHHAAAIGYRKRNKLLKNTIYESVFRILKYDCHKEKQQSPSSPSSPHASTYRPRVGGARRLRCIIPLFRRPKCTSYLIDSCIMVL